MDENPAVRDLTIACVTSVKNATGLELDLTQETLPILDHYATLAESSRDEILSLVGPMTGAYLGELVTRELGDGSWHIPGDDYAQWRLRFDRCSLTFNPIGVALEVLLQQDVPDWGAHLQTAPDDAARAARALAVFGEVRDNDFFTFSVRLEAIEQAYRGLCNDPGPLGAEG